VKRILVTGATGHIGRQVVDQLRGTGCQIRALTRNPESADLPPEVEVVRGDLAAADTLDAALTGVDAVFLVWLARLAAAPGALERIAAHAERLVLLTSPHNVPHPFFQQPNAMRSVHAGLERLIEASTLQWTFLRPTVFAVNCRHWWAPQIAKGNIVRWFHADAATSPIHERDIAAVAVRALRDEGYASREYVLTGPESLTQRQQVEIIGRAIGRPLVFEELSPDAARQELSMIMPVAIADMLLTAYGAAVDRPAHLTTTVADLTGTPARRFHDWAVENAAAFELLSPRAGVS
jgi:uncharacterized protein YbjT (DUF2867 family)